MSTSSTLSTYSNIVIFDLDHTLFHVNSSFRFGVYLYRRQFLTITKLIYLMGCYYCHKLGFMKMAALHRVTVLSFFQGKSLTLLDELISHFLENEFHQMVNPPVAQCLKNAQARGDYTIILSSSPDFLVRRIAEKFGVDEWAATSYAVAKDQTLGNMLMSMEGSDKANFVRQKIASLGVPKDNVTGYSDSYLDIPFLESVGIAIAVNPDRFLRKICRQKGWQKME